MANTMLNRNNNMLAQFQQFKSEIEKSGKNPTQILNELKASGKYSNAQIQQATNMAKMFSSLLK